MVITFAVAYAFSIAPRALAGDLILPGSSQGLVDYTEYRTTEEPRKPPKKLLDLEPSESCKKRFEAEKARKEIEAFFGCPTGRKIEIDNSGEVTVPTRYLDSEGCERFRTFWEKEKIRGEELRNGSTKSRILKWIAYDWGL